MMKLRAFAKCEGLTVPQAVDLAERGLILGAECNPFSHQWRVSEHAQLADWLIESARKPERVAPPSGASVMAAEVCSHADTNPMQAGLGALLHSLANQQAPQGRADEVEEDPPGDEFSQTAFITPEVQCSCRCLRKAVARQSRQHQKLRLDSEELVHLFRAVESVRKRARQAVGKGLAKVGDLRATDSLWHKLQDAMQRCHQGIPS